MELAKITEHATPRDIGNLYQFWDITVNSSTYKSDSPGSLIDPTLFNVTSC